MRWWQLRTIFAFLAVVIVVALLVPNNELRPAPMCQWHNSPGPCVQGITWQWDGDVYPLTAGKVVCIHRDGGVWLKETEC